MTILTVLLLTVVSTCLAQQADNTAKERSARAPPSQIQYSDPNGSKIDWKLYAPQNQWRSHLASVQRLQRAETETAQANFSPKQQASVVQAPAEVQPHYQPFSAVPSHIKQLIVESYNHQGPYVDPGAFFYQSFVPTTVASLAPQVKYDQSANSPTQYSNTQEYFNSAVNYRASGYHGNDENAGQIGKVPPKIGIKYADEERLFQRSTSLPYGSVIGAQSRDKIQYEPYKHISQSQFTQRNKQETGNQQQYRQYDKQSSQIQSQYPQTTRINSQYGQYNKQTSQIPQYTKQIAQPQQFKQYGTIKQFAEPNYQKNMPMAIQQLLNYQAQLPYNVLANQIIFRPKQLFIPKPLPESAKLSKQYPSKIYFLKTDGQIYDSPEAIKDEKNEKRY